MKLKKYTIDELKEIIKKHEKWLIDEDGGEKADLQHADLQHADLQDADLQHANLQHANLRCANLQNANLRSADLQHANLHYANLHYANLRSADLRSADLDFSSGFTFMCSSFEVKIDKKIAAQLIYHFCSMICEDEEVKKAQDSIKSLANYFHRVKECGVIK